MSTNKKAITKSKVIAILQICLGVAILFFFGLATLGGMMDLQPNEVAAFIVCIIFDVIGIVLIMCGVKCNCMVSTLNKYMRIAEGSPSIDLDEFSALVAESEYTIKKNFAWMIHKHFFDDAYINHEANAVIFREAYMQAEAKAKLAQKKVYVKQMCECCGGTTRVEKGHDGMCEYCGAPLEWNT